MCSHDLKQIGPMIECACLLITPYHYNQYAEQFDNSLHYFLCIISSYPLFVNDARGSYPQLGPQYHARLKVKCSISFLSVAKFPYRQRNGSNEPNP